MPLSVDALYRMNVTYQLYDQNCVNSFFFRSRPDSHSDTIEEEVDFLANDVYDWIIARCMARMSSQVSLVGWVVTTLNPLDGPVEARTRPGTVGTKPGVSLPSTLAMLISWQTGRSGKRLHGRTYLPGVPDSYVEGNDLTDSALAELQQTGDDIRQRYGEGGTSNRVMGGVFSRANGAQRNPGPPPHIVYQPEALVPWKKAIAKKVLATQRHRLEGRGV